MSRVLRINKYNLQEYRQNYAVLNSFDYNQEHDKLVFEGNILPVSEMIIDEIFLMMDTNDLRTFINDGFYAKSEDNFTIEKICKKLFLVEQDYHFLNEYVRKVNDRLQIYIKYRNVLENNITDSLSIRVFLQDTLLAKKIIDRSISVANPVYQNADTILAELYEKNKPVFNSQEDNQEKEQEETSNDKGVTLTRTKDNGISSNDTSNYTFNEEEYIKDKNKLGTAGFVSFIAVAAIVIVFGVYIAITALG